jgi:hypothetical protein
MGADADRGGFARWVDLGRLLGLDGDLAQERALLGADGDGRPEHDPGRRVRSLLRRMGAFSAGALTAVGAMTLPGCLGDAPSQEHLRQETTAAPAGIAAVERPDALLPTVTGPRPAAPVRPTPHRPKAKGAVQPAAASATRPRRTAARRATPLFAGHVRAVRPAAHRGARPQATEPAQAARPTPEPKLTSEPTSEPTSSPVTRPVTKPVTKATEPVTKPVTATPTLPCSDAEI